MLLVQISLIYETLDLGTSSFVVFKMELFLLLQFCFCLNLVEGMDKRILGGKPVFDSFGKYISFDDNFGDRSYKDSYRNGRNTPH
jgi:hypothetical protein